MLRQEKAVTEAPGKREQLRQERRQQILEAAFEVFTQKGFSAAKVSDVAARAGVSQGTVYWYFDSKEELLSQSLLSFFDDLGQGAMQALEQCPTASAKLRTLGEALVGFASSARGLLTLFLEFWASTTRREELGPIWIDLLDEYKDLVADIVDEGVRNGEFRPVEAEPLAWALMAAYDGLGAYDMFVPDLDLAQVSHTFIETLLRGLELDKPEEA
jgi:AcrR family transcriptional regulator